MSAAVIGGMRPGAHRDGAAHLVLSDFSGQGGRRRDRRGSPVPGLVLPGTSVACITPAQKGYSGEAMRSRKCSKTTQSRSWMATVSAEKMSRKEIEEALAQYSYLGQLEEGEEDGYRPWQLLIDGNTSPIRFSTLKNKLPTGHLEPRRGPIQQAIEYVTKETTRVTGEPRLELLCP